MLVYLIYISLNHTYPNKLLTKLSNFFILKCFLDILVIYYIYYRNIYVIRECAVLTVQGKKYIINTNLTNGYITTIIY